MIIDKDTHNIIPIKNIGILKWYLLFNNVFNWANLIKYSPGFFSIWSTLFISFPFKILINWLFLWEKTEKVLIIFSFSSSSEFSSSEEVILIMTLLLLMLFLGTTFSIDFSSSSSFSSISSLSFVISVTYIFII